MISVALTTYNGSLYIIEQLESILHQTQSIDEIVICDDGSSDNTVELIKEYLEKYKIENVRLIVNEKNLGYKKNFIKAMMFCHGDFVFLSDQDDIWLPHKVESMMHAMEDTSVMVLASSFEYINQQGMPLKERIGQKFNNDGLYNLHTVEESACVKIPFKELLRENYFQGASLCIRKNIVEEVCAKYRDYMTHDWFINLCGAKADGMYFLNTVLFQYRIHGNNSIGVPGVSQSKVAWFKQANQEEKRVLAFQNAHQYIEELRKSKDSYYQANKKELDLYYCFFEECLSIFEKRNLMKMIKISNTDMYKYFRSKKTRIMDLVFIVTHRGR